MYQDSTPVAVDDGHHGEDPDDLDEADERRLQPLAEPRVGREEDVRQVGRHGRVPVYLIQAIHF